MSIFLSGIEITNIITFCLGVLLGVVISSMIWEEYIYNKLYKNVLDKYGNSLETFIDIGKIFGKR